MFIFATKQKIMTIRTWVKEREIMGKSTFSMKELKKAFQSSTPQVLSTELGRLSRKKIITSVYKGFYVIIPVHYMGRGVVPPIYYIDQLMAYLDKPYYISLLSAAELHGAAHQRPQKFSVTTLLPRSTTSSAMNNLLVWNYRKEIPESLLCQKNSETGRVRYSSPELTAIDLIQYERQIGGLSMAATVLEELLEYTDFKKVSTELFSISNIPTFQRLGYIIDVILKDTVQANIIYNLLKENKKQMKKVPLSVATPYDNIECDRRWNVILNQTIEPDDL